MKTVRTFLNDGFFVLLFQEHRITPKQLFPSWLPDVFIEQIGKVTRNTTCPDFDSTAGISDSLSSLEFPPLPATDRETEAQVGQAIAQTHLAISDFCVLMYDVHTVGAQ